MSQDMRLVQAPRQGSLLVRVASRRYAPLGGFTPFRKQALFAVTIIVTLTGLASSRILLSPSQFVINDYMPFSPKMLLTCLLPYETAGLGRENPNAVPVFCDFGALSALLGGPAAQHVMLASAFALAGISMYLLL